jgi:hypothetical protein
LKIRTFLLGAALLVLFASLAAASAPPTPATPDQAPFCIASLQQNQTQAQEPATDELPGFTPKPSLTAVQCGACSGSCAGSNIFNVCRVSGGAIYQCLNVWGTDCSDGKPHCQCWFGPLP